ncbi:hypothetical protein JCM10213_003115 [Rhodosporidiobolus nylandii]
MASSSLSRSFDPPSRIPSPFLASTFPSNRYAFTASPLAAAAKQQQLMATPRTSSSSSAQLHRQRYIDSTPNSTASTSPGASSASSGGETEDEDDEVPPTPGDDRFEVKVAAPTPIRAHVQVKGVELSRFFDHKEADEVKPPLPAVSSISRPADQLLSPNAKSFCPSFGDFLPSVKSAEERRRGERKAQGVGLGLWAPSSPVKDEAVEHLTARTGNLALAVGEKVQEKPVFNPFVQLPTPEMAQDSFTFFPSPGFRSTDSTGGSNGNSISPSASGSTRPSSFLSPQSQPPNSKYRAAPQVEAPLFHPHLQPQQQQQQQQQLPGFPATPPRTPVRSSFAAQQQQVYSQHRQASSVSVSAAQLAGYFTVPVPVPVPVPVSVSLPPSPSYFVPTPAGVAVGRRSVSPVPPPPPSMGSEAKDYPLSPVDTDRIAKLHNGRIPSLQQLAPPEVLPGACQQPIVNTGNQGPMVVQAGDWRCGVCAFVNWRRRKICLRCFPYANDIGNILTIQSQRAAHLAAPVSSSPRSANFHIQPALPAFVPSPSASAPASYGQQHDQGVPSAHLAAAAMARSTSYPPARSYAAGGGGSLALVEQGYAPASLSHSAYVQPTQSASSGMSRAYSAPSPLSAAFPNHNQPGPSPTTPTYAAARYQQQRKEDVPLPLPPVIWNDDPASQYASAKRSNGSSSSGAGSAGELAQRRAQRAQLQNGWDGEVKVYPSLDSGSAAFTAAVQAPIPSPSPRAYTFGSSLASALAPNAGGLDKYDGGWGAAALRGYDGPAEL